LEASHKISQLRGQLGHLPNLPIYLYHLTVLPLTTLLLLLRLLLLLLLEVLLLLLLPGDLLCLCLPEGQWRIQRIACC
jgi:hypothetical protein